MTHTPPLSWTIGHDGSEGGSHAVEWALAQSGGREAHLILVRTWQLTSIDFPLSPEQIADFAPSEVCDDFDELAARAEQSGVSVSQRIVAGPAASTLLDVSAEGSLLIVGSRGLGGFRRLLLGSVSSQCATHAVVPTVVVPPTATTERAVGRIVVGLDGSERSQRALTWATEFASDDCEILVVGAWMYSKSGFEAVAQHYTSELDQARDRFNEILDEREAEIGATRFERRFAFGDPTNSLLDEAERSDLVVVGQRGHSGLSAAILGSVTTHVLHHSLVPVVVVPDAKTDASVDD